MKGCTPVHAHFLPLRSSTETVYGALVSSSKDPPRQAIEKPARFALTLLRRSTLKRKLWEIGNVDGIFHFPRFIARLPAFSTLRSADKIIKTDQAEFGSETEAAVATALLGLNASLHPIGQPKKLVET